MFICTSTRRGETPCPPHANRGLTMAQYWRKNLEGTRREANSWYSVAQRYPEQRSIGGTIVRMFRSGGIRGPFRTPYARARSLDFFCCRSESELERVSQKRGLSSTDLGDHHVGRYGWPAPPLHSIHRFELSY